MGTPKNSFLGERHGDLVNHIEQMVSLERIIRDKSKKLWTVEPCVVESYDFVMQRVSVFLKNVPGPQEIKNVPIVGVGGDLQMVRRFQKGDLGLLVFPRTDSRFSLNDHSIAQPSVPTKHGGLGPFFLPSLRALVDPVLTIEDAAATATDLDLIGPNDTAMIHKSGSFILFKENGEIVIKSAANAVYIVGANTVVSAAEGLAKGSHGSPGGHGGATSVLKAE